MPFAPTAASDSLAYAPVGLTGIAVSFSIDREPKADGSATPEQIASARLPFDSMNLTPRLIAKLLTDSYLDSLPYGAPRVHRHSPRVGRTSQE
ncbi:hypothetical protein, partial [Rhizobium johnstonii]|uniref:hypothetical protein n=1 Tax=Rhizobium johnstonii TaxID=3019933 RepID=UPI003F957F17